MTASITPYENGPLLVRGDFILSTPDGTPIESQSSTIALCRCGKSGRKPFCDGTHKLTDFRAGSSRDTAEAQAPPISGNKRCQRDADDSGMSGSEKGE